MATSLPVRTLNPEIAREELRARLDDPTLTVVDVLARESYETAHIAGALSLPLAEIPRRAREVLPDPTGEIAVYCASFT